MSINNFKTFYLFALVLFSNTILAQRQEEITLDSILNMATRNNLFLKNSYLDYHNRASQVYLSFMDMPKTRIYLNNDPTNTYNNSTLQNIIGISQDFQFPIHYYLNQKKWNVQNDFALQKYLLTREKLFKEVSILFFEIIKEKSISTQYKHLDSLFTLFYPSFEKKYKLGEISNISKIKWENKYFEIKLEKEKSQLKLMELLMKLKLQIGTEISPSQLQNNLYPIKLDSTYTSSKVVKGYFDKQKELFDINLQNQMWEYFPDFSLDLFKVVNPQQESAKILGFSIGINIPLFYMGKKSLHSQMKIKYLTLENTQVFEKNELSNKEKFLKTKIKTYRKSVDFYSNKGAYYNYELYSQAFMSYEIGEIESVKFLEMMENILHFRENALQAILEYNTAIIQLQYLTPDNL